MIDKIFLDRIEENDKKTLQNFNISQICDSGECFRMRAIGRAYL